MSVGDVKGQVGELLDQVEAASKEAMTAWHKMNDAMFATSPLLGYDDTEAAYYSGRVFACLVTMFEGLGNVEGTVTDFRGYVQSK